MADLDVTGLVSYFSRWFFFWCHKDMIQIVAGHHCSSCVKHLIDKVLKIGLILFLEFHCYGDFNYQ